MSDLVVFEGALAYIGDSVYSAEMGKDVLRSTEWINSDLQSMASNFCKLGFHLYELKRVFMDSYMRADGQAVEPGTCMEFNFYEYVQEAFGISKSSCNNFIRVCVLFSNKQNNTPVHMYIDDKYKEYGFSQLVEMASMPSHLLSKCKSSMTVRQLRELKQQDKNKCNLLIDNSEKVKQLPDDDKDERPDVWSKSSPKLVKAPLVDVYLVRTGKVLEHELMDCLTRSIKNKDKVANLVCMLEEYWQKYGL